MPSPSSPSRAGLRLLALLTFLNVLNFVDRQLVAALAPMLIEQLGLTRAQIGLLTGFAFVLVYTIAGMFGGALADRVSRPRLIAAGLACWSAATAVSGIARRFVHLLAARTFVGIGEATLTPAALSMLGEVLPRAWLARAAGIYYAGVPVGAGLSFVVSGLLAPRYGWQLCFLLLGGLGLAVSILLLRLPDPRTTSRKIDTNSGQPQRSPGPRAPHTAGTVRHGFVGAFGDLFATLRGVPAFALALAGGALVTFSAASANHLLTWLVQERGFAFQRGAYLAGAMHVAAGLVGNVAGGWFGDRCQRRWRAGRLWSVAISVTCLTPFALFFMLLPASGAAFYVSWFLAAVGWTVWYGPLFAVAQELAPARIRSTAIAFLMLVINVLGVGLGPWITGMIGDARSLTAGLIVAACVGALAVIPFTLAARAQTIAGPR